MQSNGYEIREDRVIEEHISGSVPAMQRPEFAKMLDRMESGDRLVVVKLDRLGRDNIDVQQTVALLEERGIQLVCFGLPVEDVTSPGGKLMVQLMASFAEFERGLIRERTQAGLATAKAKGVKLGRPEATATHQKVQEFKALGLSQTKVAEALHLGISTVKRHWK